MDKISLENSDQNLISEGLRQQLIELFHNPIFVVSEEGVCLTSNFAASHFLGFEGREIAERNITDFIHPDEEPKFDVRQLQQKVGAKYQEWRFVRKDGTTAWGEVYSQILPSGYWGIFVNDITERKIANEKLARERKIAETMINSLSGIFTLIDEKGKYVRWNKDFERVSGYSSDEIARMQVADFFADWEKDRIEGRFKSIFESGELELDRDFYSKNGIATPYHFVSKKVEIDDAFNILTVGLDITENKKAQEQLLKEKKFGDAVINSLPGIFYLFTEEGKYVSWNKNLEKVSGYSAEEIAQMHPLDFCPDDEKEEIGSKIAEALGAEDVLVEGHLRRKDGSEIPYIFTGRKIEINDVACVTGVGFDISQRKQAENEAYKLAAIVESSDDAIISKDFNGNILSWNKGAARIFGYTANEIIGKHASILFSPDSQDEEEKVREKLKEVEYFSNFETVRVKKDGTHFPASITASVIRDIRGEATGISVICRDITQEKQTAQAFIESEEQLRQSQKVEAVGRLAGGIAHDFNNFLAVIMLHIDMLNLQLPADSSLRYRVSEIKTVTENAAGMVKQLLAFGRKQTLQPQPLVLNQVVKQFMKVLQPLVGEDIDIQLDLDADLGVCFVDPNQINQVLMNLSVNARDAMPKGGKLKIKSENIQLNKGDIRKRKPQPTGPYIQITVTDTGTGMDPQTQKRIFEPFFTTKETGKGTGLGLATVYGIIKQSNGFVWVESEPNHGTTFKIQFPRVDQPSIEVKNEGISTFPGGTETILLVEDEEQVRRAAVEVLTVLGYQVFEAGNGTQAVQLAKLYQENINLLLTDVIMPKMNGKEVAEQIKAIHPEASVLFISGYNDDIIANHGVLDEKLHFLPKPFSPSTLAHKVREVLDLENKQD
jgi:two-component system, cell cycle sensor histidine kinase and response regulator CckA